MRKRKLLFVLLLALLPFVGWAQQKNYYGQHVSIKQTTGDSIQYDLGLCNAGLKPVIKDGKVVWSFLITTNEIVNGNWATKEKFSIDDVKYIDFRSFEYDEIEVRKALIDFYQAMDGDNWVHHENWCSDKPIWEWFGINGCDGNNKGIEYPWVSDFSFNCDPNNIPTSHKLPESVQHMGPIRTLMLANQNIEGELPAFLGKIYSLSTIYMYGNKLSGTIPVEISKLPDLYTLQLGGNRYSGMLPEVLIMNCMDGNHMPGNNLDLSYNNFYGKVPISVQHHPRFADFWPGIVLQNNPLDVSDLVIPAPLFTVKDINDNTIDLAEIYKKNKYTLLYKWGWWCSWSELFNQLLLPAYKGYKDKGFEVIGFNYGDDEGLADYLNDHDISWINIKFEDWSNFGYCPIFLWGGTPQVFLVDQNGTVVFNSLMDEKGYSQGGTLYRDELFYYLEEQLGPIDYNFYTSTDYSHDGEVITLQTATIGQGIDLVFVGEGFTDLALEDGSFEQRMHDALNQFFAYEPYTSLRDRFNVYAVKTVSPNAEFFGSNAVHAIDEDISKTLEYASKVPDLIPNRPMRVTVVYNNMSGGRSYCAMFEDDSYVCFAMEGANDVLNHEAGGHGIGKLLDEYVEQGNENLSLPEENKAELENMWTTLGWGANVDWRSNPSEVKWAKFINDARYADERIGLYEGSYLYQYGAYRPTENSMMRYNDTPFNAPSREEIYKRVMKESEGDGWAYDYEIFVQFDAAGRQQFVDALNINMARGKGDPKVQQEQRTAPPVFLKGTWRDALKKNHK